MLRPFFVRQNNVLKKVNPEDIVCLRTDKNYTNVFLSDNSKYLVRSTMARALKKLPPDIFIKIHRTYTVSIFYIDNIARDHLEIEGEAFPIGKQYYRSLINKLNIIE